MNPATMPGHLRMSQRATPSASAAPSVDATSAWRPLGGRHTPVVTSGADRGFRAAASGVCGTAGREPAAS